MEIAIYGKKKKKEDDNINQNKVFKKRRPNSVSWWDNECQKVIDDRKKKLQDFKGSKKME